MIQLDLFSTRRGVYMGIPVYIDSTGRLWTHEDAFVGRQSAGLDDMFDYIDEYNQQHGYDNESQ